MDLSAALILQDHYDVKLPCHLLLAKLAVAAPGQLLANLHRLTEPLEKTLQTKVKSDAVKQEVRELSYRPPQGLCIMPLLQDVGSDQLTGPVGRAAMDPDYFRMRLPYHHALLHVDRS